MKGPLDLAKGWFMKADSDLACARRLLAGTGPFDTACFHCQQAVEKYIKGYLGWRGQVFPFTHDLKRLAELCETIEPALKLARSEVVALTDYAVNLRYDNDFWPKKEEAADALAVAEQVRAEILPLVPEGARP